MNHSTSKPYLIAVDQGTTSSKAIVMDREGTILSVSEGFPVTGLYPEAGWVEYDPEQMFQSVCKAARSAVERAGISFQEVAALGLDNQGETTITFDSTSGHPVGNAISWQDRRTEDLIEQWRQQGLEEPIRMQTGLRLMGSERGSRGWHSVKIRKVKNGH